MAKAEGKIFDYHDESHIDASLVEVFDFDSPEQYIKTETDEFSAVCPFSGLPDISYVKIEYFPTGGKCVETFNDRMARQYSGLYRGKTCLLGVCL